MRFRPYTTRSALHALVAGAVLFCVIRLCVIAHCSTVVAQGVQNASAPCVCTPLCRESVRCPSRRARGHAHVLGAHPHPHRTPHATPPRVQLAERLQHAEALAARGATLKAAAARVCHALDALSGEQAALAAATEAFCGGVDEESVRVGCPLLRPFVALFEYLRAEQAQLTKELYSALVEPIDAQLAAPLQRIHDQRAALARAEVPERSGGSKFRLMGGGGAHKAADAPQKRRAAEEARLALAASVATWEARKEHVFLNGHVRAARALDGFFARAGARMRGVDPFLDDMERARDAGVVREVRVSSLWQRCDCMAVL